MVKHRREGANLRSPRRRFRVGAKVIVEAPAANSFAKSQHFGSSLRIGDARQHTVSVGEILRQHHRLFIACRREPDKVVSAID